MKRFTPLLFALLWTFPVMAQTFPPDRRPAFDIRVPLPSEDARVCTPLFMVVDEFEPPPPGGPAPMPAVHTWWARALGGSLDIDLVAHSVNVVEEEGFAEMFLFSPTNALIGHIVVHHPDTHNGAENVGTVHVPAAVPDGIYRVEVWVAHYPMGPMRPARHYRLRTRGADLMGMNTPLSRLAEAQPVRWTLSAQPGAPVAGQLVLGFNTGEIHGEGEVALIDETGLQRGVFSTTTGILPFFSPGPAVAAPWTLDVRRLTEHYVFNLLPPMHGAYVSWMTAGTGSVSGVLTRGGLPNTEPVRVILRDPASGWARMEMVTDSYSYEGMRPGRYRLIVRHGDGPDERQVFDVTITCDGVTLQNAELPVANADADQDGVTDDLDQCPATTWPESVPTRSLNPNHWALVDGDRQFDTVIRGRAGGTGRAYTLDDTAGCSCEQIIDALDLGDGHRKFGCSNSAMDEWVALVSGASKGGPIVSDTALPEGVHLDGNYPNPFNPETTIAFRLDESADVHLAVYDALGRQVKVLVDGVRPKGTHSVRFDAGSRPSGLYVVRLVTPEGVLMRSMLLVK